MVLGGFVGGMVGERTVWFFLFAIPVGFWERSGGVERRCSFVLLMGGGAGSRFWGKGGDKGFVRG